MRKRGSVNFPFLLQAEVQVCIRSFVHLNLTQSRVVSKSINPKIPKISNQKPSLDSPGRTSQRSQISDQRSPCAPHFLPLSTQFIRLNKSLTLLPANFVSLKKNKP